MRFTKCLRPIHFVRLLVTSQNEASRHEAIRNQAEPPVWSPTAAMPIAAQRTDPKPKIVPMIVSAVPNRSG